MRLATSGSSDQSALEKPVKTKQRSITARIVAVAWTWAKPAMSSDRRPCSGFGLVIGLFQYQRSSTTMM